MIVSNPLESDVEVSKVDWVAPPSIDTQLIDSVTLLDDQGDDKAKENQSKGDGDISKTIFLGLDPTPDIIVISAIYFVEGALGLACLKQTFLLKDELHLSPPEMSATMGIFGVAVDNQAIVWICQQWVPQFPIALGGLTLNRSCGSSFKVSVLGWSFQLLPVLTINVCMLIFCHTKMLC